MRNVSLDRHPHKLNQTTQRSVKIAQHVAKKALQSHRSTPVHDNSERSGDCRQLRSLLSSNVAAIQAKKENAEIFLEWFEGLNCYQLTYSNNEEMIKTVNDIFNNDL